MQSERAEDKPILSESDELLPISGLQHVVFCPRQAALIHVERVWRENSATTHGKILHERVDQPGQDRRAGVIIKRAVPLRSDRLRIAGLADTVEYHEDAAAPDGLRPFPVEYKRGGKRRLADEVQLCAQALCLAELHGCSVRHGALFYGAIKRRVEVEFTEQLQARNQEAKQVEVRHPFLEQNTMWGRVPHLQALLLARHLRGDLEVYPPFSIR